MSIAGKHWYESRTIWLAALMLLTAAVDAIAAGLDWRQVVLAVLAAAVAVLRLATTAPIAPLSDRSRRRPRAPGTFGGVLLLAAMLTSSCGAPAWASLCSLSGEGADRRWLCRCAVLREVVEPLAGQPRPAGALTWTCDGRPLPLRIEAADVGLPACRP